MLHKLVPTKTIPNFFTEEELEIIESYPKKYPELNGKSMASEPWMDPNFVEREIFAFNDDSKYTKANNILRQKVNQHFGTDVIIGGWHILTAYFPYRAHGDAVYGEYGIDDYHYGAWTLIIPLDDYPSATILYNEHSFHTKFIPLWARGQPVKNAIDEETRLKYLTLEAKETVDKLSIEEIFHWKRNTCFAASRYKFHGSDDFYGHGVPFKRGIIVWTALPNDSKSA